MCCFFPTPIPNHPIFFVQPLKPKEGRYLPAASLLGGQLQLAPEGHDPAPQDVLSLSPCPLALKSQAGYLTCHAKEESGGRHKLHLAAAVLLGLQNDHCSSSSSSASTASTTTATYNMVEVPRPGVLRRARLPLGATINVTPTLQLTNGLPYDVVGWALVPFGRQETAALRGLTLMAAGAGGDTSPAAGGGGGQQLPSGGGGGDGGFSDAGSGCGAAPGSGGGGGSPSPIAQAAAAGAAVGSAVAAPAMPSVSLLTGMQQLWAAESRGEAAAALARVVSASPPPLQLATLAASTSSVASPALAGTSGGGVTPGTRLRRTSWFAGSSIGNGMGTAAATPSLLQHASPPSQAAATAGGLATDDPPPESLARRLLAGAVLPATPRLRSSSLATPGGERAAAARGSSGQQRGAPVRLGGLPDRAALLGDACELLLLQRWCRDVLLEEFATTLSLVRVVQETKAVATAASVVTACIATVTLLFVITIIIASMTEGINCISLAVFVPCS